MIPLAQKEHMDINNPLCARLQEGLAKSTEAMEYRVWARGTICKIKLP